MREHKIYFLTHLPSKFPIIYHCDFAVKEGFPNQMSDQIRELWAQVITSPNTVFSYCQVPTVDNIDMNNYIKKAGIPLSHLDTNVLVQEMRLKSKKDKEAAKKRRRTGKCISLKV